MDGKGNVDRIELRSFSDETDCEVQTGKGSHAGEGDDQRVTTPGREEIHIYANGTSVI